VRLHYASANDALRHSVVRVVRNSRARYIQNRYCPDVQDPYQDRFWIGDHTTVIRVQMMNSLGTSAVFGQNHPDMPLRERETIEPDPAGASYPFHTMGDLW
jgi:hypothetical protein